MVRGESQTSKRCGKLTVSVASSTCRHCNFVVTKVYGRWVESREQMAADSGISVRELSRDLRRLVPMGRRTASGPRGDANRGNRRCSGFLSVLRQFHLALRNPEGVAICGACWNARGNVVRNYAALKALPRDSFYKVAKAAAAVVCGTGTGLKRLERLHKLAYSVLSGRLVPVHLLLSIVVKSHVGLKEQARQDAKEAIKAVMSSLADATDVDAAAEVQDAEAHAAVTRATGGKRQMETSKPQRVKRRKEAIDSGTTLVDEEQPARSPVPRPAARVAEAAIARQQLSAQLPANAVAGPNPSTIAAQPLSRRCRRPRPIHTRRAVLCGASPHGA